MKKFLSTTLAMSMILALGFTSCKSDDVDYPELTPDDKELINPAVPAEGWSGNTENGVLKFAPEQYDEDANTYFAFNMKNGVCEKGVINVVMPSATQARQIAAMLNNGTWAEEDDDEDYEADYQAASFDMTTALMKKISRANASRAGIILPIPVQQEGKVIYVVLPNAKGLSATELKMVVDLWDGNSSITPDRVIFGTYSNGVYTCNNMHGMNISYRIETEFNAAGFCTKYLTKITLPNEDWASFYYDVYEEQMWDFEQQFGQRPELSLNGNTVTVNAFIVGEISQSQIEATIYTLDWMNNCPFVYRLLS